MTKVFTVRCFRVNQVRTVHPDAPYREMPVSQSRVFLDGGDPGDPDDYQVIEGEFYPSPFELGKQYRITVEEIIP